MKDKLKSFLSIIGAVIVAALMYISQRSLIIKDLQNTLNDLPSYYSDSASVSLIEEIETAKETSKIVSLTKLRSIVKDIKEFNENIFVLDPIVGITRIEILTNDRYGEDFTKDEGYVECTIKVLNSDGTEIVDAGSKVKVRGNSTAWAEKKPYNIKFSEKTDLLGTGKTKKWSLLAECYDTSLMRNYIFQNLAKDMELEYTSQCEYVDVIFDGMYMGAYLLIEPADVGKTGVDVDIDNGDFLVEYEFERVEDNTTYIEIGKDKLRFAINEPEEPSIEQLKYVKDTMENIYSVFVSQDYEKVKEVIDVESFAKFYLVNEYAKPVDFDYSSVKFYFKDGKLYAGPVWDFDLSSNNVSVEYYERYWVGETLEERLTNLNCYDEFWCQIHFLQPLFKYEEFNELVEETFIKYSDLLTNLYIDNGFIDQTEEKYSELFKANFGTYKIDGAGWSQTDVYTKYSFQDIKNHNDNVADLKVWLAKRYDFLKRELVD